MLNDPKLVVNLSFGTNDRLEAVKLGSWSLITLEPAKKGKIDQDAPLYLLLTT